MSVTFSTIDVTILPPHAFPETDFKWFFICYQTCYFGVVIILQNTYVNAYFFIYSNFMGAHNMAFVNGLDILRVFSIIIRGM